MQDRTLREKRKATLAEAIILILLLFATFGAGAVFSLNYVPLMIVVGGFAAFLGWRRGWNDGNAPRKANHENPGGEGHSKAGGRRGSHRGQSRFQYALNRQTEGKALRLLPHSPLGSSGFRRPRFCGAAKLFLIFRHGLV